MAELHSTDTRLSRAKALALVASGAILLAAGVVFWLLVQRGARPTDPRLPLNLDSEVNKHAFVQRVAAEFDRLSSGRLTRMMSDAGDDGSLQIVASPAAEMLSVLALPGPRNRSVPWTAQSLSQEDLRFLETVLALLESEESVVAALEDRPDWTLRLARFDVDLVDRTLSRIRGAPVPAAAWILGNFERSPTEDPSE